MAYSAPVLVTPEGKALSLDRIPFKADANGLKEAWLQKFLFEHPTAIPFREIDPSLETVVPLCCEMNTGAGYVDLVFITTSGKLVLVETKLFRNPEARREVIAQILDYAKHLTVWRYEHLAARVASAASGHSSYLMEKVRAAMPSLEEARFVDAVNRSLSRADMLLVIAGDGIQTGTEALVEFLERHGGLQFSFGLIEIAVFRTPAGDTLVQPRLLARTELLRRTLLVSSEGATMTEVHGADQGDSAESEPTWHQRFWTELLEKLHFTDLTQPTPTRAPRGTNMFFPMPPNGSAAWVSAYISASRKEVGVYLYLSKAHTPNEELRAELEDERAEIERDIGLPLSWQTSSKAFTITTSRRYRDFDDAIERQSLLRYFTETVDRFINTFRPRLLSDRHSQT